MKWWQTSAILCTYGFFKEFRPSEPFISPFLTDLKNFTLDEVNKEIYPVGTYSYLFLLVVIFLLTDLLRYKPILIAGGITAVITWSLLIWGTTIKEMQVVEFFYGFFMATEIAYFSYIYTKVDKEHYKKVTVHTRSAFLLGKAGAGLSSQILIYFQFNFLELNYFTLFGVGATIPTAFFLPSVSESLYFHKKGKNKGFGLENGSSERHEIDCEEIEVTSVPKLTSKFFYKRAFLLLYKDFKQNFTNIYVLRWSIWWALATCSYLQVVSYSQLLWKKIIEDESIMLLHGYVEFATALLGAGAAFGVGYLKVPWNQWGEVSLGIITIIQGGFLLYNAYLNNLYVAYGVYIIYKLCFDAAITVATYEIAKCINENSYALVFGINTFLAVAAQTLLTAAVVVPLKINLTSQFKIYGLYHFFIGGAFLLYGIYKLIYSKKIMISNQEK